MKTIRNTLAPTAQFNSINNEVHINNFILVSNIIREKYSSRKRTMSIFLKSKRADAVERLGNSDFSFQNDNCGKTDVIIEEKFENSCKNIKRYNSLVNFENDRKSSIDRLSKISKLFDQQDIRDMTKDQLFDKQKELSIKWQRK